MKKFLLTSALEEYLWHCTLLSMKSLQPVLWWLAFWNLSNKLHVINPAICQVQLRSRGKSNRETNVRDDIIIIYEHVNNIINKHWNLSSDLEEVWPVRWVWQRKSLHSSRGSFREQFLEISWQRLPRSQISGSCRGKSPWCRFWNPPCPPCFWTVLDRISSIR